MMIEMLQDIKIDLDQSSMNSILDIVIKRVDNNSLTKYLMRCIDWINMVQKKQRHYIQELGLTVPLQLIQ